MEHDKTSNGADYIVRFDEDSTSSTDVLGSKECTCGGCGTGTPCRHDTNYIGTGSLGGVYAYAAPDVYPNTTPYPWPTDTTDRIQMTPENLRGTLYEEMLRDLLKRVQQLEGTVEQQSQDILDLRGSLDALTDIMDSQDEPAEESPLQNRLAALVAETVKLLDELHNATKRKQV